MIDYAQNIQNSNLSIYDPISPDANSRQTVSYISENH